MARGFNPYFAPAGQYTGIAEGFTNLGEAFLSANDPLNNARAEQAAWAARKSREDVADTYDQRDGRQAMADLYQNYDAATYDPRAIMSAAVRSNAYKPSDLGELMLVGAGNLPGMTDEQRVGSLVGTGKVVGADQGVSLADREAIAARNAMNDQAKAVATSNPSRDQVIANLFMTRGAGAAADARDAMYFQSSGAQPNPWLEAERRSKLEGHADGVIDQLAKNMGVDSSGVPAGLRTRVLQGAMGQIENGSTPSSAVGQLFSDYGVEAAGTGWFDGDPRLTYAEPQAAPVQVVAPAAQGGVLQEAFSAVQQGADPAAVRQRLVQMGYTEQQLSEAGI